MDEVYYGNHKVTGEQLSKLNELLEKILKELKNAR